MALKISLKQFAGMNCHYTRYSFEYFLDQMAGLGFEAIEIWGGGSHLYPPHCYPDRIKKTRAAIRERELRLICYTPEQITYPINIAALEEDIRLLSLDYYQKALQVASELESPMMLLTPGWGYLDHLRDEALKLSLDSIARITRQAEKLGIILALEHLSPISSNLINRAADLKMALDAVSSPNLKAMLDTCQVGLVQETIQDYLDLLGPNLIHVHFVDGCPGGHLVPGDGELPLQRELAVLSNYGYTGKLTLEIADRRYFLAPEKADQRSLSVISGWLDN
jgi:protein FrlC